MAACELEQAWEPVTSAPVNRWLRTRLDGERGQNVCALRRTYFLPNGEVTKRLTDTFEDEWIERATGVTTVTHHSFAAPSHWTFLHE